MFRVGRAVVPQSREGIKATTSKCYNIGVVTCNQDHPKLLGLAYKV
jgi:hypothetical protein